MAPTRRLKSSRAVTKPARSKSRPTPAHKPAKKSRPAATAAPAAGGGFAEIARYVSAPAAKADKLYPHASRKSTIGPGDVHRVIGRNMLADGFDMVVDLYRSRGARLYDSRARRSVLDFFTFFASSPIGLNHPKMMDSSFITRLGHIAINKPSNSGQTKVL